VVAAGWRHSHLLLNSPAEVAVLCHEAARRSRRSAGGERRSRCTAGAAVRMGGMRSSPCKRVSIPAMIVKFRPPRLTG
jgi:hypothetical protein